MSLIEIEEGPEEITMLAKFKKRRKNRSDSLSMRKEIRGIQNHHRHRYYYYYYYLHRKTWD